MATKCPWLSTHNATPDPASLGLKKGQFGTCGNCWLRYRVVKVNPYVLARASGSSATTILALSTAGTAAKAKEYKALLSETAVAKALRKQKLR